MSDAVNPDAVPRPLPERIGPYAVRARLGEGATSEVFLARDSFRERDVAIKRVRTDAVFDSQLGRFQSCFFAAEAALVGRLQHPNVVQISDAVPDPAGPYLVMEYVPGSTLRRFCRADALLPLTQIVEIGFKCAKALGYVFRQGLIHRDVKPANILAVTDGETVTDVKISDFGSVFALDSERTQVYRVGSLAYMSPEQLDGDPLDCRADMYSLSAVLYHLIAGRPPFDATQQAAIMQQIQHAEPPPLKSLRAGVSDALHDLVHRGLAKDPLQRFAHWDDYAQALSDLVTTQSVPRASAKDVLDSERFTLLRKLDFFKGFDDVELWEVVHRATWQRLHFGHALYRKGEESSGFHIVAEGQIEVYRDGQRVAQLGAGTSVGEMAYLAPSPALRRHSADILVTAPTTTVSFTPEAMKNLSAHTRHRFDTAFIHVLVRRLHAAHEQLAHPRRIL